MAWPPPSTRQTCASSSNLAGAASLFQAITVSIINGCSYCVHSHTAAATAKGMTREQHAELLSIVALASKTNQLATALQVPVDPVFHKA